MFEGLTFRWYGVTSPETIYLPKSPPDIEAHDVKPGESRKECE